MKNALVLMLLTMAIISGCAAKPFVVDNGTQSRVLVPCVNDTLCVRNTYEITKDSWDAAGCWPGDYRCRDYPVSYRSKNWEYETNRVEHIYMPRTLVVQ